MKKPVSFRFIKGPDGVYYVEVNDLYTFLRGNYTRLGVPDPATVYKAEQDDYNTKHLAALAPDRKKTAPAERDAARKTLSDKVIAYGHQHLFYNSNVTETDMTMMHFKIPKTPSKRYPPKDPPIVIVKLGPGRTVSLYYYKLLGGRVLDKPDGVTACIARWVMSDKKPAHISELVNEAVGTSKEIVLHFDEDARGKTIWVVVSWQIDRDRLESPATEMIEITIP
jgi:hypothetical protein